MPEARTGLCLGAAACAVISAVGCRPLFGLEDEGPEPGALCPEVRANSGEVFPPKWWVTSAAECTRAPSASDGPQIPNVPTLDPPLYFAIYDLEIGEGETWKDIGFDLDGSCLNDGADGKSCNKAGEGALDGEGCVDNSIGKLISAASNIVVELTEANINCELLFGGYNVIIKVSDYNYEANDPQVRVDVYASMGWTERTIACPPRLPIEELITKLPDYPPKGWYVMHESKAAEGSDCYREAETADPLALPGSKVCTKTAYVRGGYLVANIEQAEFWLNGQRTDFPGFRTPLNRGTFVGWIRKPVELRRWRLDATLGGVTTVAGMLEGFETLGVCEDTCPDPEPGFLGGYNATANSLTNHLDMIATEGDTTDCDALSVGWQFAAGEIAGPFFPVPDSLPRSWELSELCGDSPSPVAVCATAASRSALTQAVTPQ